MRQDNEGVAGAQGFADPAVLAAATPRGELARKLGVGGISAQDANGGLLNVSCDALDNLYNSETGDIRYNLINDTTQTINIHLEQGIFSGDWLTVTVTLPKYGFQFTGNLLADLNDQANIRNARFVKDANGYDTTIIFEVFGDTGNHYYGDVDTKYAPLTNAQCADIIANGWQDSVMTVKVEDASGRELARVDSPQVCPIEGATDDVVHVAEHKWTSVSDRVYANVKSYYDDGAYNLYTRDLFSVELDVVGSASGNGTVGLVGLTEFRLYVPDERIELVTIGDRRGYTASAKRRLHHYFTCDYVRHNDNDGRGSYYIIKASTPVYNNGTADEKESVTFYGLASWGIRRTDDDGNPLRFIEGDKTYRASDMQFSLVGAGGSAVSATGPGSEFTTLKVEWNDRYGFRASTGTYESYDRYKKYWDSTQNRYASLKKAVPGASYGSVLFVALWRHSVATGAVESRGPDGDITEVYTFPYEVQPTAVTLPKGSGSVALNSIDSVVYEVMKPDGSTYEVSATAPSGVYDPYSLVPQAPEPADMEFAGRTVAFDGLAEGERVSKVTVHWAFLCTYYPRSTSNPLANSFDYRITDAGWL